MIDQKQSNSISKVFGCVFIFFGFAMLCIGIPFITIENRNEFENTIMALSLISAVLMLIGGYQNIKKAKQKDTAINEYEEQVRQQLKFIQNAEVTNLNKEGTVNDISEIQNHQTPISVKANTSNVQSIPEYKPDVLATWNYTKEEWKLMTKEETARRLKEGIWVTILIGLLGGWVLKSSRGATFLVGFLVSLCVGIFISLLKVLLSNNLFRITKNNRIIITTNALIINGKFKTINDIDIHLEYVKTLKIKDDNFIEFSLQWQTRGGVTNDQLRIYVPKVYESEIQKILDYYSAKGVKTTD